VIYTLLDSCQRHGINPFEYLKDLFTRVPAAKITQIKEFTRQDGLVQTTIFREPGSWLLGLRFFLGLGRIDFRQ
jgi:hypothetical protein